MKAIFSYNSGLKIPIKRIHTNVRLIEERGRQKYYGCDACGECWIENINSPQIIDDNTDLSHHYKIGYTDCNVEL